MRILQINCVYKQGSTGKIVECLAQELRNMGHDVFSCYGNGEKYYDDFSKRICGPWEHKFNSFLGRLRGIQYGGLYISNQRFVRILKSYCPDIVHVHCINGSFINVYGILRFLARENVKTVVTLHAEIFHTGGCAHAYDCDKWKRGCHDCTVFKKECHSYFFDRSQDCWNKIYNTFQAFNPKNLRVTAVSPWLTERAKQSDILKGFDVITVLNGLNTEVFHFRENTNLIDRQAFNRVLLFVAPYFNLNEGDLKGGRYVKLLAERMSDSKVVVVATRVESNKSNLPDNVQLWGRACSQDELAQIYSESDATVLFSSRETFSMVTAESLCCGTTVVGFKAGGPESIALPEFSHFVEYGELESLVDVIRDLKINNTGEQATMKDRISKIGMGAYSQSVMSENYLNVYRTLTSAT